MKVVVATRNRHKVREIAALLAEAGLGIEAVTIDEVAPAADLVENEETFEGNALAKARQAAAACGRIRNRRDVRPTVGRDRILLVQFRLLEPEILQCPHPIPK